MDRSLDPLIEALRNAGASFALLHGSQVNGNARSDSDLDVAAYWTENAPGSWEVAVPDGVDLLVLNDAPLEIAGRVAQGGQLLFDDNPKQRVHWQAFTRKIWFDERPRFERAHREFMEAVGGR